MLATATWPDVAIALVAALPAIISAWYAHGIKRDIRTPSGSTIGAVSEKAQQSAHANHQLLKAINGDTIRAKYVEQGLAEPLGSEHGDVDRLGDDEHT